MSIWNKLFGSGDAKPKKNHTTDSKQQIQEKIASGQAIMLDCRSQEEFDAGRLKDVVFIPIAKIKELPESATELEGLDKTKIVYCH